MAKSGKSFIRRIWSSFQKLVLFFFISSLLYTILCKWVMPPITITQAVDGMSYGLKRDYIGYHQISKNVVYAAIASEDQLFPEHFGFDWASIEKSLERKGKKNRKRGAAASTISQQTAKNVFLWRGSGISRYIRKIPEAYFTLLIELIWGKQRILEVYLNTIEMGPGIFGIEAAAQYYYHKPASKLSRAEAASIIACLPNPKKYTVKPMSRFVAWKQQHILRQMNNIDGDSEIIKLLQ